MNNDFDEISKIEREISDALNEEIEDISSTYHTAVETSKLG